MRFARGSTAVQSLEEQLLERDAILDDLKGQLFRAQQKMKHWEDAHRREVKYEVGDWVYLKLQPYRQQSLAKRAFEKLAPRYYGPFEITQCIGKVAYKLNLPATSKIHPVFHASQLKAAIGGLPASPQLPPQLTADLVLEVEPEEILEVRNGKQGSSAVVEFLVKWKGLPSFEATWEEFHALDQRFPLFHLEDKVNLWARGNAMNQPKHPPVIFTYSRRRLSKAAHHSQPKPQREQLRHLSHGTAGRGVAGSSGFVV